VRRDLRVGEASGKHFKLTTAKNANPVVHGNGEGASRSAHGDRSKGSEGEHASRGEQGPDLVRGHGASRVKSFKVGGEGGLGQHEMSICQVAPSVKLFYYETSNFLRASLAHSVS
jgi:hypothetical protein